MAVRVLAVLKGRSCVFGSLSYIRRTSGVHAVPVVGDRKDACALRYPNVHQFGVFRGMTIRIEESCV